MIRFIDLFAGIGGIRMGFEIAAKKAHIPLQCVFSSEIDKFARQTYTANFGDEPDGDITDIPTSEIPEHDILFAGFPCQPFSLAGVSKKNSLGREHGFDDEKSGNLFLYIAGILEAKRPAAFLLENVKYLRGHDSGKTFDVIKIVLEEILGYRISHQVIDGQNYTPQHRERIFIAGIREDLLPEDLLPDWKFDFPETPDREKTFLDILQENVDDKYTLSDNLWSYLQEYKERHRRRGNGFGYSKVEKKADTVTRTLSARYHKDGSEILVHQDNKNPRRLTPRECARLMGYPDTFEIPVSDTQAYRQFGNSVVVPVIEDIARLFLPQVYQLVQQTRQPAIWHHAQLSAPNQGFWLRRMQHVGMPSLYAPVF